MLEELWVSGRKIVISSYLVLVHDIWELVLEGATGVCALTTSEKVVVTLAVFGIRSELIGIISKQGFLSRQEIVGRWVLQNLFDLGLSCTKMLEGQNY